MQYVRGAFILSLLIGLPTLAIVGDMNQLMAAFTNQPGSRRKVVAVNGPNPEPKQETPGEDAADAETPQTDPSDLPSVFPKMKRQAEEANDAEIESRSGRSLRSAVYRPRADANANDIRRKLAEKNMQQPAEKSIEEMAQQLQTMGALSYRMDDENGLFTFTCEFPPQGSEGNPVRFQSQSEVGSSAVRNVLAQARTWHLSTH